MEAIKDYFELLVSEDYMSASVQMRQEYDPADLTKDEFISWLKSEKITYGLNQQSIDLIVNTCSEDIFPINVAQGTEPIHGIDGKIDYVCDQDNYFDEDEKRDFRDVKKIPSLEEGEKIAILTDPVKGKSGHTIFGKKLPAKKGKPIKLRPGKNVRYDEESKTFFATEVGQLSVGSSKINVFNTYEVSQDLSMETGNVSFVGSVIVRGNVPAGYRVEADGDVHIYGLVEAGHIEAGGNVVITEGIAGLKKGSIKANGDVTIGYINQAHVHAEHNINVQNSIMHSQCVAKQHIYCQSGSIVGGSCSAGKTIEAKDIGNKMDTKTEVAIGVDQEQFQLETKLNAAKDTLISEIEKLKTLGQNLEEKAKKTGGLSSKERIFLIKQKNTLQQTEGKLDQINERIESLHVQIGDEDRAKLIVKGTLHENVDLCFGKYQQTTTKPYKFSQVFIEEGEISISPL
ncbi:hypothetical protein SAMN05421734_102193 [Pelagirhabdus alkalitolerans]|uniref:Flagellar Assembly Protein A N-terminal region domain-containing protein n=1 Tax=Pelagirhabdus alkalitolerans TaxID=1612202 RepID=A0A1G6H3S7_9BACI|nr:FapA family protein [Pelagirhabdus alkalitolerans]SDB88919.1 hypothetical protein SAMN05421734_102193 [Pelagirhabdus alkalitolerans]